VWGVGAGIIIVVTLLFISVFRGSELLDDKVQT